MLQNYLKTGMVFYKDRDKQHFRNDCCKEVFCQETDKTHFPSFQIYSKHDVTSYGGPLITGYSIFDLDDNKIADLGITGLDADFYHHADGGITISHDFRDEVAYNGSVKYDTCYYVQVAFYDGFGYGYEYWYSEVFKVCDCDVIGVGDGENLIINGYFEDWDLAANPNNTPDNWTVVNNNATNYVDNRPPAAGFAHCRLISDNTQALLIRQTILTVGEWYTFTIDIIAVASGAIYLSNGGTFIQSFTTTGAYNITFQAVHTQVWIVRVAACDVTFSNVTIEQFVGFAFCDRITLVWWANCDWDDIIYQNSYRNSLVLDTELQQPIEDIEKKENTRLGENFPSNIIIKKRYQFKIRIPEYLWNALLRLPAYGGEQPNFKAWLVMPIYDYDELFNSDAGATIIEAGEGCPMSEVAISGEWDTSNCMNTFVVEFVDNDEYPVVATNCCDNEDISEV